MTATNRPVTTGLNAFYDLHKNKFFEVMDGLVNNTLGQKDQPVSVMGVKMSAEQVKALRERPEMDLKMIQETGIVPIPDPRQEEELRNRYKYHPKNKP